MQYTSRTPLNRLVDTARPESESVRAMELAAARVVKSASSEDVVTLREQFARWAANDMRFQALANGNALLEELKPLSKELAAIGRAGLRALDYLSGNGQPPDGWVAEQQKAVARALEPHVEVTMAAARPLKVLLDGLAAR
jgi:hexosaminidase